MPQPKKTRPLIRALLIDISGNLHVGSHVTQNATECLHRLRTSNIPFRLCSNTSKESTASLISRLNKLGFSVGSQATALPPASGFVNGDLVPDSENKRCGPQWRQEVWTSISATAQYLHKHDFKRPFLLLSPSAKEEVVASTTSCWSESDQPGDFGDSPSSPYDSVVVGLAPDLLDYSHLNTAFRILKREYRTDVKMVPPTDQWSGSSDHSRSATLPHPQLIATHKANYIQTEVPFGLSLGPGPFVTALETAAGVEAHVIGKPTRLFFQTVIDNFYDSAELEREDGYTGIAVIGDDVEADLGEGAVEIGLWRVLVKTGKYRPGDENRPGVVPPDEVFESFSSFIEELLTKQKQNVYSHKL